jgi:hypothetical protein
MRSLAYPNRRELAYALLIIDRIASDVIDVTGNELDYFLNCTFGAGKRLSGNCMAPVAPNRSLRYESPELSGLFADGDCRISRAHQRGPCGRAVQDGWRDRGAAWHVIKERS